MAVHGRRRAEGWGGEGEEERELGIGEGAEGQHHGEEAQPGEVPANREQALEEEGQDPGEGAESILLFLVSCKCGDGSFFGEDRGRGERAVFFIALPHPRPLPEGEGIWHHLLPNVKICAEHYWAQSGWGTKGTRSSTPWLTSTPKLRSLFGSQWKHQLKGFGA